MVKKEQASKRASGVCLCVSTFFFFPNIEVCVCAEVLCCVVRSSRRSVNGAKTYDILLEKDGGGVIMCEFVLAGYLLFGYLMCGTAACCCCCYDYFFYCYARSSFSHFGVCKSVSECCSSQGAAAFTSAVASYTSISLYLSERYTCVFKFYLSNRDVYIMYVCEFICWANVFD